MSSNIAISNLVLISSGYSPIYIHLYSIKML
uniref:Uncharacterized protein n=1 Tax=Rhizophora mucronata TaxID=61149 RepID=A0A2P2NNP1_RHIMU